MQYRCPVLQLHYQNSLPSNLQATIKFTQTYFRTITLFTNLTIRLFGHPFHFSFYFTPSREIKIIIYLVLVECSRLTFLKKKKKQKDF